MDESGFHIAPAHHGAIDFRAVALYFMLLVGAEAVNFILHSLYLSIYQFTSLISQKRSSFFTLFNIICISGLLRSFYWLLTVTISHWFANIIPSHGRTLLLSISLYMDVFEDQFWQCMIFLLAFNSLMCQKKIYGTFNIFGKQLATIMVAVFMILCSFASLMFIHFSEMRRIYLGSFGILDAGEHTIGNRVIDRVFYAFPGAAAFCCIVHFFLVSRQNKNKTLPAGTTFIRQNGIFVPLIITIVLNGISCVLMELMMSKDYTDDVGKKIVQVRLLNCFNLAVKVSLPLMVLFSNLVFREKQQEFATEPEFHS